MTLKHHPEAPPADRVLVLSRTFDAPRELVFDARTRPEHLVRWFGPNDFTLPFCESDFRVGGAYRFNMHSPEGVDYWVWGVYREIVPPERLIFTWERDGMEGRPEIRTVVTLSFEEAGARTLFTLHHATFGTTADRDGHRGGWTECLERLAAYLAHESI